MFTIGNDDEGIQAFENNKINIKYKNKRLFQISTGECRKRWVKSRIESMHNFCR